MTGETRISDECYGCVDLSGTTNKTQTSSVGLIEKVEKNPSNSSQSSPIKVTEDHEPVTDSSQEDKEVNIVSWDEIIEGIDKEMERLGWDRQFGQRYIMEKYGKKSRQVLSDRQLLEFLAHLKSQPKFKVGQTAIFRGTKVVIERLINKFVAVVRSYEHPFEKPIEVSINHLSFSV